MKIVEIPFDPTEIDIHFTRPESEDYPHYIYDYSTDDLNHYEFQQNLALKASYGE